MLPIKTETVHRIRFYALANEIYEVFGQRVDVLWNDDQFCNGAFREVDVDGESELLDIDDEANILAWLANPNEQLSIEFALHLLFQRNLIPAGRYLVEIVW